MLKQEKIVIDKCVKTSVIFMNNLYVWPDEPTWRFNCSNGLLSVRTKLFIRYIIPVNIECDTSTGENPLRGFILTKNVYMYYI